jgi:hypothetical protein
MTPQKFTDLIEDICGIMPGFRVLSVAPGCVTVQDNGGDAHLIEVCAAVEDDAILDAYSAALDALDPAEELQKWQDDDLHAQLEDTTYDGDQNPLDYADKSGDSRFANGITLGGMANDS